ncbi:MAG: L-threonylcarbamoyladenylate synthase [Bacteroidales bacterium]|nr:L-threonylcarbamoyladenylate synthase [Bacteroidales bacterium]
MTLTESIDLTLKTLRSGGIILYPTDTVWGLGCDATNSDAVNKIIELKGRSHNQSFILLVDDVKQIEHYIEQLPDIAYSLIEVSDTPLTIIYPGARSITLQHDGLAPKVIAPDGTVAIRVVQHPFCCQLLQKLGKPIVSTSANFTGIPAPLTFSDIDPNLRKQVDHCVDPAFEAPATGKPSSIIKLELNGEVVVIRP